MVLKVDSEKVQLLDDTKLIELIWQVFGVAIDFGTDRKDIIKTLWRLSS